MAQTLTIAGVGENPYGCPNRMSNRKALDKPPQGTPEKAGQQVLMAKKDTYKYELHDGHRTVYVGTTNDPERREAEHRADGKEFTKMTIIGGPSTSEGAGKWEEERIDTYKRNHGGDRPKYNQNDSGK